MLNDVWFASAENMVFIKTALKKDFVMPLKSNRKAALSVRAKQNGQCHKAETLELEAMQPAAVHLESVPFALLLAKQVFTNEDGTTGVLHLATSDAAISGDSISTLCQKRWNVEPYHKSLGSGSKTLSI